MAPELASYRLLDRHESVGRIRERLEERFPDQAFEALLNRHTDVVTIRWMDGPTEFAVRQATKDLTRRHITDGRIPAIDAITTVRWFSPETLRALVQRNAPSYRTAPPLVIEVDTLGTRRAVILPVYNTEGREPMTESHLRTWELAIENYNGYEAPKPEPIPAPPGPDFSFQCRAYDEESLVSGTVTRQAGGGYLIRTSAAPCKAARLAISGSLGGQWNRFRRAWWSPASLDRIQSTLSNLE